MQIRNNLLRPLIRFEAYPLIAHIESFHAILEEKWLSRYEFTSYQEACQTVIDYIQFYNERRIHGSLFDLRLVNSGSNWQQVNLNPL
ncbi:MAG: integrase core domain-containing protein [Desulfocucumaceae bacterium]